MSVYGYARVSTDGQTLDAQIAQLKTAGAEKIFREKLSGARADRPELARLLRSLGPGDSVLVNKVRLLELRGGVSISLDMHVADTAAGSFEVLADHFVQ